MRDISIVDKSKKWTIYMDINDKKDVVLTLYQVINEINLGKEFSNEIQKLLYENLHYIPSENIKKIISPDNIDCKGKALFLILCFLKNYAEQQTGSLNYYLFGELKNEGYRLLASGDHTLNEKKFRFFMQIITKKPELVKNLIVTYAPYS